MAAVMPEAEQEDIQHGYSAVGHIGERTTTIFSKIL